MEEGNKEQWTITKPFDTLLLKYWTDNNTQKLKDSLSGLSEPDIVEALTPNKKKSEYYENNILSKTISNFLRSPNLCDRYKYCQNVTQHSLGLSCVTGAAIRKRLLPYHEDKLGTLNNRDFQSDVINNANYTLHRKNLGVLIFDCPDNGNSLRKHAMKVLFDNFYLYTTPRIDVLPADSNREESVNNIVTFIIKQISRNADCMIIFVDEVLSERWSQNDDCVVHILVKSICWDFKIKIIILSVCPKADHVASEIYKHLITIKPIILMYHELEMAPTGGLVSLIEEACKLSFKNTITKYWLRGMEVLNVFKINNIIEQSS